MFLVIKLLISLKMHYIYTNLKKNFFQQCHDMKIKNKKLCNVEYNIAINLFSR